MVLLEASGNAATSASAAGGKIGKVGSPTITSTGMVTEAHCARHGSCWFRLSRAVSYASVGATWQMMLDSLKKIVEQG